MNRRLFLSGLAGFGLAGLVDPAELIWRPKKTIFIPRPLPIAVDVWFGVDVEFDEAYGRMIARSALQVLKDNLSLAKMIERDYAGRMAIVRAAERHGQMTILRDSSDGRATGR